MSCGFTGGKASDKFFQYKKSQSTLFILGNRKWITFYIKDDNGKLWVEVIIVIIIFFYGIATEDVIVVINNDVNFIETQRIHFAWLNRSLFRFERINKVDLDFSQGQILSFVFPLKYHVIFAINPKARAMMVGIVNNWSINSLLCQKRRCINIFSEDAPCGLMHVYWVQSVPHFFLQEDNLHLE